MTAEDDLLAAWRNGDQQAADTLLRRHFDGIYRFFRAKLTGDDVEDLVQRTFVAAVEGVDRIGEAGFRSYLFGVARIQLLDHLRRRYRRGETIDLLAMSIADLATGPSREVARRQGHDLLISAMRSLPVDSQILLELAYWEEFSGKQIAAAMQLDPNTVRSRLARARAALREAVQQMIGHDATDSLLRSTARLAPATNR